MSQCVFFRGSVLTGMLLGVLVGLSPLVRGAQSQSNGKDVKTADDNLVEFVTRDSRFSALFAISKRGSKSITERLVSNEAD